MPTPTEDAVLHYAELAQQHLDHVYPIDGDLSSGTPDMALRAAAVYAQFAQIAETARLTDALAQRLDDVAETVQDVADRLNELVRAVNPGSGPVRRWLAARRPFRMTLT